MIFTMNPLKQYDLLSVAAGVKDSSFPLEQYMVKAPAWEESLKDSLKSSAPKSISSHSRNSESEGLSVSVDIRSDSIAVQGTYVIG